ncbi:MAG: cellulase family glycosylhydrolase [Candidatus Lokiarchaeota archaeon]|nr:cellulase family glycosylhydrolase [Candidatus Lokiarchaeota archaeon]MBD3338836.1 cellulase family glycosylhydrolase [Candidatus Lokiarchaeota archaeon]
MNRNDFLTDSFLKQLSAKRWDEEKANKWYKKQPWFVGCNYIPSTAINQLEMFQESTFDLQQIDKELQLAEDIGLNALRIFLHNLLWEDDSSSFKKRIKKFLEISEKHNMKILFVLFDEMWNQFPKLGAQPTPIPGIHNSGWVAGPGKKRIKKIEDFPIFRDYVQDIISTFAKDNRIIGWDIYNEPGNMGIRKRSLPLVIAGISWARKINPSQPITVGAYYDPFYPKINEICFNQSDIISFHDYSKAEETLKIIKTLNEFNRPILCTEYLARTHKNLFESHLPIFKKHKIGAFHWGLVAGKTQTIYPWDSKKGNAEPELWYHDVFYPDGTPYSQNEIEFIKEIIKKHKKINYTNKRNDK